LERLDRRFGFGAENAVGHEVITEPDELLLQDGHGVAGGTVGYGFAG